MRTTKIGLWRVFLTTLTVFALSAIIVSCASQAGGSMSGGAKGNAAGSGGTGSSAMSDVVGLKSKINHIVVIYQENWSFDGLYGLFPGADGLEHAAGDSLSQKTKDGTTLSVAPAPLNGKNADANFANADLASLLKPFDLSKYIKTDTLTGDLVHRFYTNQLQIDGGKNDKFVAWSDNGGLVMSYFDGTNLPEGKLAQQYTLFDHFFMGAFGGSFLNHQYLIAAAAPTFPNAPASIVSIAPSADGMTVADKQVTPDGFVVNTSYSVNQPIPAFVTDKTTLVPNQTNPTIGDRLSEKKLSWAWYAGGWNDALAGKPDPLFQFHHQPFAYYENYKDGTEAKKIHLRDENDFLAAVDSGTLPSVSFVKPLGSMNEHPGYATLATGQQHVAELVKKLQDSSYWKDTAIIITYDENGGRWDHVAPPKVDAFGPGTRVPTILISPFAKKGFIEHATLDTTSILKLIEQRWDLKPLNKRDDNAGSMLDAFQF